MSQGNGRTPLLNRVPNIRNQLTNDLFNQNWMWRDTTRIEPEGVTYNIVDLFSGAGGLTLGFKMAGYRPVFGVEIDPDACATYRKNFPEAYHHEGLIENLTDDEVLEIVGDQEIHALCAGFPCQGFSVAGARRADDQRNALFYQFVRFARLLKPWFVVGENVANIVTLAKGVIHKAILREFAAAGYPDMTTLVLESAEYGVAQLRPRAIYVGNRFGLANPYPEPILPEPEDWIPIEEAIDDLKSHPRDPSINHEWTRHGDEMIERLSKVGPGESLYDTYQDAWKRQYKGVPAMTIKENHGGVHIHHELDRTISAREMARLQSFPDDFIFSGRMKRVMFQVGNAVPPLLAKHVALALRPSLEEIATARWLNGEEEGGREGERTLFSEMATEELV